MPHAAQTAQAGRRPMVFISYAHEDAAFDASVEALAEHIRAHGFEVVSDHLYKNKPPPQRWTPWMQHSIEAADFILVVCTPKMKAIFEGRGDLKVRGATVESVYLVEAITARLNFNTCCYPILPDGGDREHVPVLLKGWFNDHRFPSGYGRIIGLFRDTKPTGASAHAAAPTPGSSKDARADDLLAPKGTPAAEPSSGRREAQVRTALEYLEDPLAAEFLPALRSELFPNEGDKVDVSRIIERCTLPSDATQEQIHELIGHVRDALHAARLKSSVANEEARIAAVERAAVSLYYLAVMRFVRRGEASRVLVDDPRRHGVVDVPTKSPVLCAVIAAALFGISIEIRHKSGLLDPLPPGVVTIDLAAARIGDPALWLNKFKRRLYCEVRWYDPNADEVAESDKPLPPEDESALVAALNVKEEGFLKSRLRAGRDSPRFVFIIGDPEAHRASLENANETLKARILVAKQKNDPTACTLLGMDPEELEGFMEEFLDRVARYSKRRSATSVASAGRATRTEATQTSPEEILRLVAELLQAIAAVPDRERRTSLAVGGTTLQRELAELPPRNPRAVSEALKTFDSIARPLNNARSLLDVLQRLASAVAPYLTGL